MAQDEQGIQLNRIIDGIPFLIATPLAIHRMIKIYWKITQMLIKLDSDYMILSVSTVAAMMTLTHQFTSVIFFSIEITRKIKQLTSHNMKFVCVCVNEHSSLQLGFGLTRWNGIHKFAGWVSLRMKIVGIYRKWNQFMRIIANKMFGGHTSKYERYDTLSVSVAHSLFFTFNKYFFCFIFIILLNAT